MKLRNILFLLLSSSNLVVYAQLPTLQEKLQGKDRVEEIMEIVDAHYAEIEAGVRDRTDEKHYKHWARWGLYMSARTDDQGRIVPVDRYVRRARENYTAQQRASTGNWTSIGPTEISGSHGSAVGIGRVDRIAFHPTDANTLYIGTTAGGLYKSTNGGTSWSAISSNLPSTAISGIVVSHADPNIIYVLTGDGDASDGGFIFSAGYWRESAGVFVSYDGGANWYPTGPLNVQPPYAGFALAMDPNNANVLLAATSKGLYRTDDAGATWEEVLDFRTFEVKFKPGSSTTAYATQDGSFFRSTDGGVTWNEVTNFDFGLIGPRIAMAVTNAASGRVYLLDGWAFNDEFRGMYLSTDSGASFTRQSNTPNIVESSCDGTGGNNQSMYDLAIGVSHSTVSRVVAAGITTWRSSDTGGTWVNASAGRCDDDSESTGYVHADVHDIEYNPLNNDVYVCTDGGLIKSENHGVDWINLSDGIDASQIYHMAGSLTNTNNMLIGLQDNGVKRRDANSTVWDQVLSADGYDCIYNHNGAVTGYLSWNKSVNRFSDNGLTRVDITPPGTNAYFPRVTSAIHSTAIVLAGFDDIYRSDDSGDTWTNVGASGFWDIERCPSFTDRFYAAGGNSAFATTGSMWRSDDEGETWTMISGNTGYPSGSIRLTDIDVEPDNSTHVWITFGGFSDGNKVFYSSDSGASWTNLSGDLPNIPVNAIQVDASNNAYIGTDIGVFYRAVGGEWVPFWHLLPIVPVTDLEIYEEEGFIRAATFGRGVWQSDLHSACVTSTAIISSLSGNRYYQASNSISYRGAVFGGQNTNITFKSGGSVLISANSIISAGTRVRAHIAPCGVADLED